MPSVKVCFWNVQNYGAAEDESGYRWGKSNQLRARLVAKVVRELGLDVLMLTEPSVNSGAALGELRDLLNGMYAQNGDWAASRCGCSLTPLSRNPPTGPEQLQYATERRVEGYAVLWRTAQADRFTMLRGIHQIADVTLPAGQPSPLNLTLGGRPSDKAPRLEKPTKNNWFPTGGYLSGSAFPLEHGNHLRGWPELLMPPTGASNPNLLSLDKARRPAYVVLDLKTRSNELSERLCPVCVYHAPSWGKAAALGVLQSALARELYATDPIDANRTPDPSREPVWTRRHVLGGDFNHAVIGAKWDQSNYRYFTRPHGRNDDCGAACEAAPSPGLEGKERDTVVALVNEHNEPIVSSKVSAYLRQPIDLAFFAPGSKGVRVNVLELLLDDRDKFFADPLRDLYAHLADVEAHSMLVEEVEVERGPMKRAKKGDDLVPLFSTAWGGATIEWQQLLKQLSEGRIRDARRAAELYALFISDHLPVAVEVEF